ncbi:hypothetical protein NKI39_29420 [Mesorhizobium sp. M0664]|uniref:hypothetical protein n=1 Tax=Mesorhizobium sp. M0664 TaxID=2956982 RepID=UPI0033385E4E
MNQAQKIFRLIRGDCCLAFCGDAQVAYPFFIQVGTALDNHIKTRTRALDITHLTSTIGRMLNKLIEAWDLPKREKIEQLATTRILVGGWSWENTRFDIGYFKCERSGLFKFHHQKARSNHPWHETQKSLVFLGDYEDDYMASLDALLSSRFERPKAIDQKVTINFDYEPIEALNALLEQRRPDHSAIGGSPQLVKIYPFSNTLPFVIRNRRGHFLMGRALFDWEKTEYPILDLTADKATVLYPMERIPLPADLTDVAQIAAKQDAEASAPARPEVPSTEW